MKISKLNLCLSLLSPCIIGAKNVEKPNFIIIFCDDMGYGDLSCYGHPSIKTPNLDRLAQEGQKWSNFYAAAPVSTPSRAGLMTGRIPARNGQDQIYFPFSISGLPQSEITIASLLKENGYTTACVGKWHLGHLDEYMPWNHGFDYFYGIPYSNDMSKKEQKNMGVNNYKYELPFYNQKEIIEYEPDQTLFTKRLTEYSIDFIKQQKDSPFFLYLAHPMPHIPVYASDDFSGTSLRGKYGDAVEEIDWSVGEIIKALEKYDLDENTIVIFSSDNGPWLSEKENGGSAGILAEGKGSSYEGGFRVPGIFWGKKIVKSKYITDIGSTLDILPTICDYANINLPKDRIYDGISLRKTISGDGNLQRNEFYYYRNNELFAVRKGRYKAHFIIQSVYPQGKKIYLKEPLLYDLGVDPSETTDISKDFPEIVKELCSMAQEHKSNITQK